jgi:aminomethyltransferase
VKKTALH